MNFVFNHGICGNEPVDLGIDTGEGSLLHGVGHTMECVWCMGRGA